MVQSIEIDGECVARIPLIQVKKYKMSPTQVVFPQCMTPNVRCPKNLQSSSKSFSPSCFYGSQIMKAMLRYEFL